LRCHGLLAPDPAALRRRCEREAPNDLWQLACMGHRPVDDGQRVHLLADAYDHSRFLLTLATCPWPSWPTTARRGAPAGRAG
jgi:hypothetical protein